MKMNRERYIKLMREMLDEMEADHEEHTGVKSDELMTFGNWQSEINNLYLNTRA